MKFKIKDMLGQKFNMLTIIEFSHINEKDGLAMWKCLCDCGNTSIARGSVIRNGMRKSCGCILGKNSTHRQSVNRKPTFVYTIWSQIKQRCYNPKATYYKHYGGRGIIVCERWIHSFENFYSDIGVPPTTKHSIERKNVNGNYDPDNCRWATKKEQNRNMRKNVWVEFNGTKMILKDFADLINGPSSYVGVLLKKYTPEHISNIYKNKIK